MLKILWQLPQILLGYILVFISKAKREDDYLGMKVYLTKYRFGISLGNIIIVCRKSSIKHEYGHCKQSIIFGPFYLLIIGLPSIVMNTLTRVGILKKENYYKRWPENWADKLGNV